MDGPNGGIRKLLYFRVLALLEESQAWVRSAAFAARAVRSLRGLEFRSGFAAVSVRGVSGFSGDRKVSAGFSHGNASASAPFAAIGFVHQKWQ